MFNVYSTPPIGRVVKRARYLSILVSVTYCSFANTFVSLLNYYTNRLLSIFETKQLKKVRSTHGGKDQSPHPRSVQYFLLLPVLQVSRKNALCRGLWTGLQMQNIRDRDDPLLQKSEHQAGTA